MNELITVVVPVYNEAGLLARNMALLEGYLKTLSASYELILVNDGSSDASGKICHELAADSPCIRAIVNDINRGKGHAVKEGILAGEGTYRIFLDADLAVPAAFISPCLKRLRNGTDIVIGSRHLPRSSLKIREGPLRQFMGSIYRNMVRRALGLKVSDVTCGLKGFRAHAAVRIFSRSMIDRWGYDAELIFLAQQLDHDIAEIPVKWFHSFDSKVLIGLDAIRSFLEMLQILRFHRQGRYRIP